MTGSFACRACGAHDVAPVLSLGRTPLANALIDPAEPSLPEETFPLEVVRCTRSRACATIVSENDEK
jgi:novobiocin biosynthesis protein NovU/D-mycarose 3-C-methyltransferase